MLNRYFLKPFNVVWRWIGIILFALLCLESASNFLFYLKDHLSTRPAYPVLAADSYGLDHSWVKDYWHAFYSAAYKWQPYIYWRLKEFNGPYTVEGQGIRKTWNPPDSGGKPIRIFMFGGSTMWGVGARDDGTIPSRLSRILHEQTGKAIEVTNFAQPGYVNTQEFLTLVLELENHHSPDIAIFYDGINDVYSALVNREAGLSEFEVGRSREFNILQASRRKALLTEFIRSALLNSSTAEIVRRLAGFHVKNTLPPASYNSLADSVIDLYASNIRLIENFGRMKNFQPLFYWQPLIFTKSHLTAYEQTHLNTVPDRPLFGLVGENVDRSPLLAAIPEFHNIRHILDADPNPRYLDYCHLSESGNEIIARRMSQDVLRLLERPARGARDIYVRVPRQPRKMQLDPLHGIFREQTRDLRSVRGEVGWTNRSVLFRT